MPEEISIEKRIVLIGAAIERCETAERLMREAPPMPAWAAPSEHARLLQHIQNCEREFGWQWRNVQEVLKHMAAAHD